MPWYVIRTVAGKEGRVFRALDGIASERWLPESLCIIRGRHHTVHREIWRVLLPGYFFAKLSPTAMTQVWGIDDCQGVLGPDGEYPIAIPYEELQAFRTGLTIENAARSRLAAAIPARGVAKTKPRPSRKLLRPGKQAERVREWAYRVIKADGLLPTPSNHAT